MTARIRKGDTVVVIAGKDKGKTGTVREVLTDRDRAIVSEVNVAKRHYKPGRSTQQGIVEKEMPIHMSNLQPVDPKTGKGTRVRVKTLDDGRKVRVATGSGEQFDK
jgi:large subunit ribosomal protein L24